MGDTLCGDVCVNVRGGAPSLCVPSQFSEAEPRFAVAPRAD